MASDPRKRPRKKGPGPIFRSKLPFTKVVPPEILWGLFESNDILGKVRRGELRELIRENQPDPIRKLPAGTVSQYITYVTPAGRIVAEAHRFVFPPPTPPSPYDPKKVVDGLVTYIRQL